MSPLGNSKLYEAKHLKQSAVSI